MVKSIDIEVMLPCKDEQFSKAFKNEDLLKIGTFVQKWVLFKIRIIGTVCLFVFNAFYITNGQLNPTQLQFLTNEEGTVIITCESLLIFNPNSFSLQ